MINKELLLGNWKLVSGPYGENERVYVTFDTDSKLTYTIEGQDGKRQIIFLTYKLEEGYLITDQPSDPHIERTKLSFVDNQLVLDYNGTVSVFAKEIG